MESSTAKGASVKAVLPALPFADESEMGALMIRALALY